MAFKIVRNDIVKMNTQAIVNTANEEVAVGTGCDRAVYQAAGHDELLAYRREHIGRVAEGEAFITPGFNLQAEYIIHAVSPFYQDGNEGEEEKLRKCYRKCLELAKENKITSIAFPLISTGGFGYPKEEGMRIAIDAFNEFLMKDEMDIYLVVFDTRATQLGERLYPELEAYIDHNYVLDKRGVEYDNRYFNSVTPDDSRFDEYRIGRYELEERLAKNRTPRVGRSLSAPNSMPKPMATSTSAPMQAPTIGKPTDLDLEDKEECASICFDKEMAPYDVKEQESGLQERLRHLSDTFSEYLLYLINNKGLENATVYKNAIVDKKTFSKIKNNKDYHPQKITALCLCVGARLNLDETKDLLARAGYALSPCDKTDVIFSFFIENEIYDMIDLDIQLEEHGLPCIIK